METKAELRICAAVLYIGCVLNVYCVEDTHTHTKIKCPFPVLSVPVRLVTDAMRNMCGIIYCET